MEGLHFLGSGYSLHKIALCMPPCASAIHRWTFVGLAVEGFVFQHGRKLSANTFKCQGFATVGNGVQQKRLGKTNGGGVRPILAVNDMCAVGVRN